MKIATAVMLLGVLASVPVCIAGEYAVLRTGFRIHAQKHETVNGSATIRLHTVNGTMDVPAGDVAGFEVEEYVPPPPPPPPAPIVAVKAPVRTLTPAEMLYHAAEKHGLRPEFVASVAKAESAMRTNAVSPMGAIGLMQLMPGTAQELGVDPHDPMQNAEAGARYLK